MELLNLHIIMTQCFILLRYSPLKSEILDYGDQTVKGCSTRTISRVISLIDYHK